MNPEIQVELVLRADPRFQPCPQCDEFKEEDEFAPSRWGKSGAYCRECANEHQRRRYRENKEYREKQQETARRRYQENPEVRQQQKDRMDRLLAEPGAEEERRRYNREYKRRQRQDPEFREEELSQQRKRRRAQ